MIDQPVTQIASTDDIFLLSHDGKVYGYKQKEPSTLYKLKTNGMYDKVKNIYGAWAFDPIAVTETNAIYKWPKLDEFQSYVGSSEFVSEDGQVLLRDDGLYISNTKIEIPYMHDKFINAQRMTFVYGHALFTTHDVYVTSHVQTLAAFGSLIEVVWEHEYTLLARIKPTPEFTPSNISRVMLWRKSQFGLHVPIVILKDGRSYTASESLWTPFHHDIDVNRTTYNLIVFNNGTMMSFYWFSQGVRIVPMPKEFKKIKQAIKTEYGVAAIMLKCSRHFTGDDCDIPLCFGYLCNYVYALVAILGLAVVTLGVTILRGIIAAVFFRVTRIQTQKRNNQVEMEELIQELNL